MTNQPTEGYVLRSGQSGVFLTRFSDAEGWGPLADAKVFATRKEAEDAKRLLWMPSHIEVLRYRGGKVEESS